MFFYQMNPLHLGGLQCSSLELLTKTIQGEAIVKRKRPPSSPRAFSYSRVKPEEWIMKVRRWGSLLDSSSFCVPKYVCVCILVCACIWMEPPWVGGGGHVYEELGSGWAYISLSLTRTGIFPISHQDWFFNARPEISHGKFKKKSNVALHIFSFQRWF